MNKFNHKKIFFNRAKVIKSNRIHCDNCFEQVVFLLRDKDHEFSLGMKSILECLAFAVKTEICQSFRQVGYLMLKMLLIFILMKKSLIMIMRHLKKGILKNEIF